MKNELLEITENQIKIIGSQPSEVMGDWELPLMELTASKFNKDLNGNYLEIGFGLGIMANQLWRPEINSYTIVEIHPQIIPLVYEWAKDKQNVRIIYGDWFDNIELINDRNYDGIYFDTHLDYNRSEFRNLVVNSQLNVDGVFSYFTMGDVDVFNYNERLLLDSINIKTPTWSDYKGFELEFVVSYFINNYGIHSKISL